MATTGAPFELKQTLWKSEHQRKSRELFTRSSELYDHAYVDRLAPYRTRIYTNGLTVNKSTLPREWKSTG